MSAKSSDQLNVDTNQAVIHAKQRWDYINKMLQRTPKFQNKNQAPASEETIQQLESNLNIVLPAEIRNFVYVHNGRNHIAYGLNYRLPTTDLLPVSQWRPYETESFDFVETLYECIKDKNYACVNQTLNQDFEQHLSIPLNELKEKLSSRNSTSSCIPCELLIIGEGMDDYAEQYLLSLRSGRIYLAVHNIPEWMLIGNFDDWIEKALRNIEEQYSEMLETHESIEIE